MKRNMQQKINNNAYNQQQLSWLIPAAIINDVPYHPEMHWEDLFRAIKEKHDKATGEKQCIKSM